MKNQPIDSPIMESINKTKLYMLLELEKLKENYKKLIGVFPFPISQLKFHILLVKDNKKMIFELRKKSVEEDWCLYSQEKLLNEHFDNEGLFQFKNKEAFKVLKTLTEVIEVNVIEVNKEEKEEEIIDIEDVITEHQVYLKAMENFNKAKEEDEEDVNRLAELEKRHKNKNSYLLETLCDKGQE